MPAWRHWIAAGVVLSLCCSPAAAQVSDPQGEIDLHLRNAEVLAANHDLPSLTKAYFEIKYAVFMGKQWSFAEGEATAHAGCGILWGQMPPAMIATAQAHGGTAADCMGALPNEWKLDGDHAVWVYRQAGAVQKVYTFGADGKLISAIAP